MYDDWPGYTKAFLASHFDEYDTNKDGKLTIEEFRVSSKTAKWGWTFYEHIASSSGRSWTLFLADAMFNAFNKDPANPPVNHHEGPVCQRHPVATVQGLLRLLRR